MIVNDYASRTGTSMDREYRAVQDSYLSYHLQQKRHPALAYNRQPY